MGCWGGATPLDLAIECNREKIVRSLAWEKRELLTGMYHQVTPLHIAAHSSTMYLGITAIFEFLLDKQPDVDAAIIAKEEKGQLQAKDGNTPLHEAVLAKNVRAVELLLKRGADRNKKNGAGITPTQLAKNGSEAMKGLFSKRIFRKK